MADYYKNDDDKIVNTEPTPLDPSPKVVVVENEETGELAPSPKAVADTFVDGEHNQDKKVVGQAPIKFPIPPVREMTYTDLVNVIKEVSESGDDSAVWGKISGNITNQTDLMNALANVGVDVVELSNLSGTLSDSDYAKVSGNNCIIKLSTQYYYKDFDASTLIVYSAFTREGTSDLVLETIEITKSDKTWEYKATTGSSLFTGKFVRIMDAPTSTTLTDEQIAQIVEGVFIKGQFLGLKNPILLPAYLDSDTTNYYGGLIGNFGSGNEIVYSTYVIGSNKSIEARINAGDIRIDGRYYTIKIGSGRVLSKISLAGKNLPDYPSNTGTFVLKCVNGTLTWVAD